MTQGKQSRPVTFADFCEAADRLLVRDGSVTADGIKADMGRGSKGTHCRHLRQWRERQRQEVKATKDAFGISDQLGRALLKEINSRIGEVKEELEEALKQAQKDYDVANDSLDKAEQDKEQIAGKIDEIQIEAARQKAEYDKALASANSKIEQLDKNINKQEKDKQLLIEQNQQALTELAKKELIAETADQLKEEIKALGEADKGRAVAEAQVVELRRQLDRYESGAVQ